ncbi:MAG: T9SS type A sorting domain-containing protein [Bacteroidales bacterium]
MIIKYNYLLNTPNGIQRKSNGMTDVSGAVAYNIIKNPKVGIVVKGMGGVRIYNNTLYCEKTTAETDRGLIDIHTNTDNGLNAPSTGVRVFNNIFYTKYQTLCINVMDQESLVGFESDYNVFWCETGAPLFSAGGSVKTFSEWQALGYDTHSVVLNPSFNNYNDFVPPARLDYGTDLGDEFKAGIAVDAVWGTTDPRKVNQNGKWQVGARIYEEETNGEEELPQNITRIYPNPASGNFYVLLTDTNRIYQSLTVYDSTGRILLMKPVEYGLNIIPIPASLSAGLYNILLEAEGLDRYLRKIILLN